MKVGWVVDPAEYVGGAELTMAEFKAAAPDGTDIVDCPADGEWPLDPDVYVVGNCVTYDRGRVQDLAITGKPVVKYVHDAWTWGDKELRAWLLENALCVFTSPLHRKTFKWNPERWDIVPPPVDVERFRAESNTARSQEAVHVGRFYWTGKGADLLADWARAAKTRLNVFGSGPFKPPPSEWVVDRGDLTYEQVPGALASYFKFVHLPTGVEPFGRAVVEARAAGCRLVVNRNVGALYYIEEEPERLETAARDLWKLVIREALR